MTALDVFTAAAATLHAALGEDGWLTTRTNARTSVKVFVHVPDRGELVGEAAISLRNRIIRLPPNTGTTGDLVSVGTVTWILGRAPEYDSLGLSATWIGVPLTLRTGSLAYHATGYPLVAWDGVEWVQTTS